MEFVMWCSIESEVPNFSGSQSFDLEKDLTAAAEKLAECQEIIFLLGKQLYSLRPQTKFMGSSSIDRINNVSYSPSDTEVNNPLRSPISSKSPKPDWPTKSGSSSSAGPTPEKQEMDFVLIEFIRLFFR
ncbi:hypothetical protein H5410_023487 [Solanum commersonii]|uniref:Uncharacterized protein n=1 Tax=Solanum commersonii TaxID=4109 RepID=A0A9J5ZK28_SOLCO|nr:hypothetical protein H5410_023487 [Solanum commersonii]